jgi:hypothetical protein
MSSERRVLGTSGCARAARATARDDSTLRWALGRWSPPWPPRTEARRETLRRAPRRACGPASLRSRVRPAAGCLRGGRPTW